MYISHEVLTRDQAYQVANLDGKLSKDPELYSESNCLTYYVAINTWYYLVYECDKWAASALLDKIQRCGLLSIIAECDNDATALVKGEEPSSDIGKLLAMVAPGYRRKYFGQDQEKNFSRDDFASTLQLLRYLKRFSPNNNDWVKEEGYNNFVVNENYTKQKQRREYPYWLIKAVRDEISDVLNWKSIINGIKSLDIYDFTIPSGTTYEGYRTVEEKVNALFAQYPEAAYMPFGLPYVIPYYKDITDKYASRVQAVPKSYKSSRIIAMEPLYRQAYSQRIMQLIIRYLPEHLDVTDQTRNQELARQGSINPERYATLDASNASDLISKSLFRSVFPPEFVRLIDPFISTFTDVNGKIRPMQMMSTAGHSLTFVLETLVYYGIAAAACRYSSLFTGQYAEASVYGDDVVISSIAARTAIEFYSMLGLRINESKSFLSGHYRESCGEEYLDGINTSSIYYPRFPVIGTISSKSIHLGVRMYRDTYRGKIDDSTTMLVDLQKRLFGISYNASLFVWEVVRAARPKITSSAFGSICNDLWTATDLGQPYNTTDHAIRSGAAVPATVTALCDTQKHSYASIQYTTPKSKLSEWSQRNFDIYRYQNFLRTGPSYSDPLLKLLGVSDPPLSEAAYRGEGKLVWRYSF